MFKKRTQKGNIRRETPKVDDEDDTEEIDMQALKDLKAEQNLKKKLRPGQSLESLVEDEKQTSATGTKRKRGHETIAQSMASQFSATVDNGLSVTSHEKIMEKYIEDKLGIQQTDAEDTKPKVNAEIAEIYQLPDEIKGTSANQSADDKQDDNEVGLLGVGAGIAEVALPIAFKLSNIQATEHAREKRESNSTNGSSGSAKGLGSLSGHRQQPKNVAGLRFQNTTPKDFMPRVMGRGSGAIIQHFTGRNEGGQAPRGLPRRSDDISFDRFKKNALNFRR